MFEMLAFSKNLAIFLGLLTPLIETYRRWSTWQADPPSFFDDYILGGLLLFGVWQVSKNAATGQKYLTLAWGFAFGMVYSSFFYQLRMIGSVENDPSGFPTEVAVAVKGLGFLLVLIGLITSLGGTKVDVGKNQ